MPGALRICSHFVEAICENKRLVALMRSFKKHAVFKKSFSYKEKCELITK